MCLSRAVGWGSHTPTHAPTTTLEMSRPHRTRELLLSTLRVCLTMPPSLPCSLHSSLPHSFPHPLHSSHLSLQFLIKFFDSYKEFAENDFWITGEVIQA